MTSPFLAKSDTTRAWKSFLHWPSGYADDTIVGFEHEHEAQAFLHDLQERMGLFDLALHPEKTRLICFGRYAAKQRAARGEGKPEVFVQPLSHHGHADPQRSLPRDAGPDR
jgi:hypothetical protein